MERLLPRQPVPCSSLFAQASQPYYLVAPGYDAAAGAATQAAQVLHRLCSALNQLGHAAYMVSEGLNGELWTPVLTDAVKLAHYRAGKKPVVVHTGLARGLPLQIGLGVRYLLHFPGAGEAQPAPQELVFTSDSAFLAGVPQLRLPFLDLRQVLQGDRLAPGQRSRLAYYHQRYSAEGGKLPDFGPDAVEITDKNPATEAQRLELLRSAKILYTFELAVPVFEALLSGCAVVFMPDPKRDPRSGEFLGLNRLSGIAWDHEPESVARALASAPLARDELLQRFAGWSEQLQDFVRLTQHAANRLTPEQAWPLPALDQLPGVCKTAAEDAARTDRLFWRTLHEQYQQWSRRRSLREIDADIYAEHVSAGRVQALTLVIDQRGASPDQLADSLDSLGQCLGQVAALHIVADTPAPAALDEADGVVWHEVAADAPVGSLTVATEWLLLLVSGARLDPRALLEWGLAPAQFAQAHLIYADDDLWSEDAQQRYPHFKPDANIELLRCSNYLGQALAFRHSTWERLGRPLASASLYAAALHLLHEQGRSALGHIDTVLVHAGRGIDSATEAREFDMAQALLLDQQVAQRIQALPRWGTWLPEHSLVGQPGVALVVPTGLQTGYLRNLLLAAAKLNDLPLQEAVLVCQQQHLDEVQQASANTLPAPIRIVTLPDGEYCHAAALNAGVAAVQAEFVLICDDDTEPLHKGWLARLVAIAQQADVGLVAPRLFTPSSSEPKVIGGPVVLGIQGVAATYRGLQGLPDEVGVYSRLQLTQDCSAVTGHCCLLRTELWRQAGGLRADRYPLFFPLLDLCLRLGERGLRHVWTPLSGMAHHGGKSLELRRSDIHDKIRLADQELIERQRLLQDWASALANDRCYNRQLSLWSPFEIDADIVVEWVPQRRERPRLLALPLSSGSGQFRVVEPMQLLQTEGWLQSSVILPKANNRRALQPLELCRAAPDVLLLQHSVDDGIEALVRSYKTAAPNVLMLQVVDDLLGQVPEKHPNFVFQSREGHRRMVQALLASDRLIVTTETLQDYYRKYVPDVRLVPNSLDEPWFAQSPRRNTGARLRVGWIGAGQHRGDLELIEPIVAEFAAEVDWIFMGMATEGIRRHCHEFHGFVPIGDYPAKMATLALDIAIAPLEDNFFNQCKSNLRLLEYGAMGWPVLCSDVYPYRTDDPPVLRCANLDEWRSGLRHLIDQPQERARMGAELRLWVERHYRLKNLARLWYDAIFAADPNAVRRPPAPADRSPVSA